METKRFSAEDLASGMPAVNPQPVQAEPEKKAPEKSKTSKIDAGSAKRYAATAAAAVGGAVIGGAAVAAGRSFDSSVASAAGVQPKAQLEEVDMSTEPQQNSDSIPEVMATSDENMEQSSMIGTAVNPAAEAVADPAMDPAMAQAQAQPNTMLIDLDHDGKIDLVAVDENGDGIGDAVFERVEVEPAEPEPPTVEYKEIDLDGDGVVDTLAADTNNDGLIDVVLSDTDGDGMIDLAMADTNYDGEVDQFAMDINGDGNPDLAWDANEGGVAGLDDDLNPDLDLA